MDGHTRTKPGETMAKTLREREARLHQKLAMLELQKKAAREKVTGKTRARAYTRIWLEKLTATELRHEVEIRDAIYGNFETMEQAIDYVLVAMFDGTATYASTFDIADSVPDAVPLSVHE